MVWTVAGCGFGAMSLGLYEDGTDDSEIHFTSVCKGSLYDSSCSELYPSDNEDLSGACGRRAMPS